MTEYERLEQRLKAIMVLSENRDICPVCGNQLTQFEQVTRQYVGTRPISGVLLVCLRCEREYGTWSEID